MPTHKQNLRLLSLNQLSEITGIGYRTLKKKLANVDPQEEDGRTLLYNSIDALQQIYLGINDSDGADDSQDGEEGRGKINIARETARNIKLRNDHLAHDLEVKRGT